MEIISTFDFSGTKGTAVRLTLGSHITGVNVLLDYCGNVTTFNRDYFGDILIALVLGVEHVENLPGYCQCETCRKARGKMLAEQIATAQAERLHRATVICQGAGGHTFVACTDNAEICQACGCHKGNHDA